MVNYHLPLIGLGFGDQANWAGMDQGNGDLGKGPTRCVPPLSQPLYTSVPPPFSLKQMGDSLW